MAKRRGSAYFKGDRVKRGNWSKKRWSRSVSLDRKRRGSKYEKWEKRRSSKRNKDFDFFTF